MFMLTIFNTLADLIILWLLVTVSRSEDEVQPFAVLVQVSAVPYIARLYPTIIRLVTFSMDYSYENIKDVIQSLFMIYTRDRMYESIMLGTCLFTMISAAVMILIYLEKSFRNDTKINGPQIRKLVLLPLCVGLFFMMMFYNGLFFAFEIHSLKKHKDCLLFAIFTIISVILAACLIFVPWKIRNRKCLEKTELRDTLLRQIGCAQIFAIVSLVPLLYMLYNMLPFSYVREFFFADFENFVRCIFLAALLILEPYGSRIRLRERFYRIENTGNQNQQRTNAASSLQVQNVQQNAIQTEDAPPSYQTGEPLPQKFPLPSYEMTRTMMRNPYDDQEVSMEDVKIKRMAVTPVEGN